MFDSNVGCLALFGILVLAIALIFAEVWIAMLLWNALAVGLFGLPVLTYWQIFGIKILLGIIFPSSFNWNSKNT